MAEGTESAYQPNRFRKPDPLPDVVLGSPIYKLGPQGERIRVGRKELHPNAPAPPKEPTPDRRPQVLYTGQEFTAEYWEKRLALNAEREADKNGRQ